VYKTVIVQNMENGNIREDVFIVKERVNGIQHHKDVIDSMGIINVFIYVMRLFLLY
jgi:hypothetical protein